MFYVYILYSESLNRFYIGSTKNLQNRVAKHHVNYFGNKKFTSKADDWILYYSFECETEIQARKIESHIKNMKSSKYIENLRNLILLNQR